MAETEFLPKKWGKTQNHFRARKSCIIIPISVTPFRHAYPILTYFAPPCHHAKCARDPFFFRWPLPVETCCFFPVRAVDRK